MKIKIKKIVTSILGVCASVMVAIACALPMSACGNKTLDDIYSKYFKVGAMVAIKTESDDILGYEDSILRNFNSFTAENEMKWKYTENTRDQFTFELGDTLIEQAKALGAGVRGHALVWRDSCPDYVLRDATKYSIISDIQNHIDATVKHYGHDVVYAWDVVNEAISDSNDPNEIYYDWDMYRIAGEDYIFEAFKAARAADDQIKLYYNDYSLINPVKRAKAITMIKKMQSLGIPIDGIGEQAHYNIRSFDYEQFEQMLIDFSELGLEISITELDFSVYADDSETQIDGITPELEALQAEAYAKVFEICRKYKDKIGSVTTWGIADDHTWLDNHPVENRKDYPLLFDEFCEPKKAWDAIRNFKYQTAISDDVKDDITYNVYNGKGDFHFAKWYGGEEDDGIYPEEIEKDGQTVTEVLYTKIIDYSEVKANIAGNLNGMKYINFTLSADKNMLLMAQSNYYVTDSISDKVIGEETFDVGTTKKTYSIEIPTSKYLHLNLLNSVWLFPEPGEIGPSQFRGTFYIYDAWFSETKPDSVSEDDVMKPSGASSAVQEKAYKRTGQDTWYNETSWTKYKMKLSSTGLVDISSTGAATWGYVSVNLSDIALDHNRIKFSYIDNSENGNSVSYIRFRLRGSMRGMTNDGVNTYMTYWDKDLTDWINDGRSGDDYTQLQSGGPISVTKTGNQTDVVYDISDELKSINDRGGLDLSESGYGLRLVILIETVGYSAGDGKDYSPKYPSDYPDESLRGTTVVGDKSFDITVMDVKTYTE